MICFPGLGIAFLELIVVLPNPCADPPSSPENLHVLGTDTGQISLQWQPAKSTEKSPVDVYVVEMATGDRKDFVEVARVDGKTCRFDATDLQDGQKYNFHVKARNSAGNSDGSAQLDKPVIASKIGKAFSVLGGLYSRAFSCE